MPADFPLSDGRQWTDITTPTLVIATRGDPIHPFAIAETIAARIPTATLLEVPSIEINPCAQTRAIAESLVTFADKMQNPHGQTDGPLDPRAHR
jgi:pimeloyl-ACP methyl ester carboxylesterase